MAILLVLAILLLVLLIAGPQWWVRHVLQKHARARKDLPGTGGQLARHLCERFGLTDVKVEAGQEGQDHYDPLARTVRLSPSFFEGRSLSAVAVAAHEVGHAIQHHRDERLMSWRTQWGPSLVRIQRIASLVLIAAPLAGVLGKAPQFSVLLVLAAIALMGSRLIFHLTTLPLEWDASFGKALPILRQGEYLPERDMPAVRSVLKAAALTYVASALIELLQFWRWIRYWR